MCIFQPHRAFECSATLYNQRETGAEAYRDASDGRGASVFINSNPAYIYGNIQYTCISISVYSAVQDGINQPKTRGTVM